MAKTIGRYEIREELGRGGMAAVYLAYDSRLDRQVALKLMDQQLSQDPTFATRFEREAKTVAGLSHNAVVSLYDFGEADGWLYLVMPYMEGGTLKEQIASGPLTTRQAYNVVRRIGSALDKAHSQNIIHRDLKPANILLDEEQEPYLSDFGIVKVAKGDTEYLTETGQTLGTYAYMSPEQIMGQPVDGRSDLYALGIVLYEMLTGNHPYSEATTSGAMAVAHAQQSVPDVTEGNPALPAALNDVVRRAMAKDPGHRYSSGREMTLALYEALTGKPAAAATEPQKKTPTGPPPPAEPEAREATEQPSSPEKQPAPQPEPAGRQKRKTPIWIFAVIGIVAIACIGIVTMAGLSAIGGSTNGNENASFEPPAGLTGENFNQNESATAVGQANEAEEPTEEPTEGPTEEPITDPAVLFPDFEPTSFAADNCDYGGIIGAVSAVDALTVRFDLCRPDPAFLAKIASTPFGIQSMEWLQEAGGTSRLLKQPVGTGPYMVDEWLEGDQIVFRRFDDYWGDPAPAETAVLSWRTDGTERLLELQSGTVDYITDVNPDDLEAVEGDPNLVLLPVETPNILYLGMSNAFQPFDDEKVRQAIAMGIDRQRLVENYFSQGSEVASHFTPCSIPNGCTGDLWYDFNPEAGRQLLADAGYPDGFSTTIYYRDVSRNYLPDPSLVVADIQTQLQEYLGIEAEIAVMESGEFVTEAIGGNLDGLYLLGWSADYPHVTSFLDFHFGASSTQYGEPYPEIYDPLAEGAMIADLAEAAPLYTLANEAIRELVPMVPIAHGAASNAALASLDGAYAPPFGAIQFYKMDPGDDTLVFMQSAEPISLYCPDETDGETFRSCQQVTESLLEYDDDSGELVPELATSCHADDAAGKVWTCQLRPGVLFHDGSMLDANDVVFNWAVGMDATHPLHIGNSGRFDYYKILFNGLINDSE